MSNLFLGEGYNLSHEKHYTEFLREHVELKTYKQRDNFNNLNESEKFNVSDKVIATLYKTAIDKYSLIDFGNIPDSKGDITRLKQYHDMKDTIQTIQELLGQTGKTMEEINTIDQSVKVLEAYSKDFVMGFMQDKALVVILYNTITLSIISGLQLCITSAIDFLKTPGGELADSVSNNYNAKSHFTVVVDNLNKFNTTANNGELKKFFESTLKKDNFIGAGLGAVTVSSSVLLGVGAVLGAIAIIPLMRELLYFLYNFRMSLSEYIKLQAAFLETNVVELQNSDMKGKDKIIKRQEAKIKQLKSLANSVEIKFNKANESTKRELEKKIDVTTDTQSNMFNMI